MSEQLEIEFKTLLSAADYHRIIQLYQLTENQFQLQKNYYYDTTDSALKEKHCGLRVRLYQTKAELTLKIPAQDGLLETTETLSLQEGQQLIEQNTITHNGPVANRLAQLDIAIDQLQIFADLTTRRAEFPITEGLLALDESWYGQHHDFELELEVKDRKLGQAAFLQLLKQLKLTFQPAENKIIRALNAKNIS